MAPSAYAATHTVDDDKADCPAATFTSIQAAVDAAASGDTITVCAGDYAEGTGAPGTNALTITKSLTLKGAGADLVSISPKANPLVRGSIIEEGTSDIRNGVGDIVAIVGTPTQPLTVNISGVTVNGYDPQGREVAVEAGILYLDAKGSINRSARDEHRHLRRRQRLHPRRRLAWPAARHRHRPDFQRAARPRGRRAQARASTASRVDKYNKIGILIDGAQNDCGAVHRRPARSTGASSPPARSSAARECVELRRHRQLRQRRGLAHHRPAVRPGRPARHQRLLRHGRQSR